MTTAVSTGGGNMSMTTDFGGVDSSTGGFASNITSYASTVTVGAGCATCAVGSYQWRFQGDIAEVIAYSRALSASEISTIEAYLAAKWAV